MKITSNQLQTGVWVALAVAVGLVAGGLRLSYLAYDLPAGAGIGTDESYYYLWARTLRETGRPDVENGSGYPPAFLYLLAGQQTVTERVRGAALDPAVDHFYVARFVNGLFGIANVGEDWFFGRPDAAERLKHACNRLAAIATSGAKPVAVVLGPTETLNAEHRAAVDEVRDSFAAAGIAVFPSVERAAWAIGRMVAAH